MKFVGQWIARSVILFATAAAHRMRRSFKDSPHLAQGWRRKLRAQTLAVCREGFAIGSSTKIDAARWPESARAFEPLGLWAEPDGAYLLIDSDADGERGIYLPRILSEKDPLCSATLTHVKLGEGVNWYDRRR